jgi:hypothetical protein
MQEFLVDKLVGDLWFHVTFVLWLSDASGPVSSDHNDE